MLTLANFMRERIEDISIEFERFARTLLPPAVHIDSEELRDSVPDLVLAFATDLEADQTQLESMDKSACDWTSCMAGDQAILRR